MAKENNPVYLHQLPSGRKVYVDAAGMVHSTNPNLPFNWESHQTEFDSRPSNPEGWDTVETSIPEAERG